MQRDVLIWLVAGLGLGVFLTMAAFMLIVAFDGRGFRRRLRRAETMPDAGAMVRRAHVAPPVPERKTRGEDAPKAVAAFKPTVSKTTGSAGAPDKSPAAGAAAEAKKPAPAASAAEPARSLVPAAPPKSDVPVEDAPQLSVEELFARAFEAAVPTMQRDKPASEPSET